MVKHPVPRSRPGIAHKPVFGTKTVLATLLALVFTGCSTHSPNSSETERLSRALRQRGLDPARVTIPFVLNEGTRRWAHALASAKLSDEEKLRRLAEGLLDSKELDLEYSWGYTGTANEVFESHRANCLAFTNLFLAMAREVGVPVYFLAVETETFRKQGNFIVVSDHIAVGYGEGQMVQTYDFSAQESATNSTQRRRVRPISDLSAIAAYHSNRGAEMMQSGQLTEALEWLRTAVALDPQMPKAWVNLGVARRQTGDLDGAEMAYRQAMALDPTTYSAYQNLATLLRTLKRESEAQELEDALVAVSHKNPFTYLSLGDLSFRQGRMDEARRFYRRAASMSQRHAESFAALGHLAAVTGDLDRARRLLRKAQKIDQSNERTVRLASLIADDQS